MSDQPDGGASAPSDKPKFLSGATGWIGGLTALVIAFTGLLKACDQFAPAEEAKPKQELAATAAAPAEANAAEPEADAPTLFRGDNIKLQWMDDDKWQLTDSQGTYAYEELVDPSGRNLMAFNKAEDSYLRWPEEGGMLEESVDDKASWAGLGKVEPAEASQ